MLNESQQSIINQAVEILSSTFHREDMKKISSTSVKQFCQLKLAHLEHEVFGAMFLDSQYRLIKFDQLFRGTIDSASVYPREVAKEALLSNAAAVILSHNHPSGSAELSQADKDITERLVDALGLLDIKVLDHIVVSKNEAVSFAERGLL